MTWKPNPDLNYEIAPPPVADFAVTRFDRAVFWTFFIASMGMEMVLLVRTILQVAR